MKLIKDCLNLTLEGSTGTNCFGWNFIYELRFVILSVIILSIVLIVFQLIDKKKRIKHDKDMGGY